MDADALEFAPRLTRGSFGCGGPVAGNDGWIYVSTSSGGSWSIARLHPTRSQYPSRPK